MKAYETSATVEAQGQVRLSGVPFAPGTQVEVTISPIRRSGQEFAAAWQRVSAQLRSRASLQNVSDEEIQKEIDGYRAGE
jgi:hypothetical protein